MEKCLYSDDWNHFFHKAVTSTPTHDFIPWAVVKDRELTQSDRDMINNNVLKWACDNYDGKKPESCSKTSISFSLIDG